MMRALSAVAAVILIAGCGERPQTGSASKLDVAPHQGTGLPYVNSGWKPGDRTSWETQLRTRTQQGQNDYVKVN